MKSKFIALYLSCLFCLSFLSLPSLVQSQETKIVVVPFGDDARPLQNIVTVAKENGDFSDPVAAVNSISDPCATGPWLVVIAPGVFTLQSQLIMRECVSIAGSGKFVSILEGSRASGVIGADAALVITADQTQLRDLTIRNDGASAIGPRSIGVFVDQNSSLVNLHVEAINNSDSYAAVIEGDKISTVLNSDFIANASTNARALLARFGVELDVNHSRFKTVDASSSIAVFITTNSTRATISDSVMETEGGDAINIGFANFSIDTVLQNSRVVSRDSLNDDVGVSNTSPTGTLVVRDSRIDASDNTLDIVGNTYIFDSFLEGGPVSGSPTCVNVFSGSGALLDASCQTPP